MKINHNELLTYPNKFDQRLFASVHQAYDMGAAAVGATIYFGSPESDRQIEEISAAFAQAHELGLVTILWCYLRNNAFKQNGTDYHTAADLTGQANHRCHYQADIIKRNSENNGGYKASNLAKLTRMSMTNSPRIINHLCRYQVANCYMGRMGLIIPAVPPAKMTRGCNYWSSASAPAVWD